MSDSKQAFIDWLAEQLNAENLSIDGWTSPSDTGYSNETNIFDATFQRNGEQVTQKLVQRLGPIGPTMFKEYDLEKQCRCMAYLNNHSSLPVPKVVGQNMSVERPYYVMEFIGGDIPKDGHTADSAYTTSGFIFEATPADREKYFNSLVTCIAELEKVPVSEDFKAYFGKTTDGDTPLQQEINWWIDLYHWGKGGKDVPLSPDSHVEWLANNIPDMDDCNIVWNDARPANTIAQNHETVAILDWELATFGPSELDLFFHFTMHETRENQPGANKLDGIPSEAEQIALYEKITGHKVRHEAFFRRYMKIKMAVIQLVFCRAHKMELKDIDFAVLEGTEFKGNYEGAIN